MSTRERIAEILRDYMVCAAATDRLYYEIVEPLEGGVAGDQAKARVRTAETKASKREAVRRSREETSRLRMEWGTARHRLVQASIHYGATDRYAPTFPGVDTELARAKAAADYFVHRLLPLGGDTDARPSDPPSIMYDHQTPSPA